MVLDLIQRLREERGLTVVLVTHDPSVASRADRVVRMLDGRITGEESSLAQARVAITGTAPGRT
jgi:putative ABC transport system ATP-binding protein